MEGQPSAEATRESKKAAGGNGRGGHTTPSAKLRGHPKDDPKVRISKTVSWILRHGSQSEGLAMRPDGYVRVTELLTLPRMRDVDFTMLEQLVANDNKSRYNLISEPAEDQDSDSSQRIWWIRANQGHSLKSVELDLDPITSITDIPTGVAVHGTSRKAWETIRTQGLHRMTRNHIHLAQGVTGSGVISGMRRSSQIFIYIDIQKALDAGIKFFLSSNGVVLTEGDAEGYLKPQFFQKVETAAGKPAPDWEDRQIDNRL